MHMTDTIRICAIQKPLLMHCGLDQMPLSPSPLLPPCRQQTVNVPDATSLSYFSCIAVGHEVCVCLCVSTCEMQISRRGVRCL